jgi:hypothetical protein
MEVDKKLFFHLLDLTTQNNCIVLTACGKKNESQKLFHYFGPKFVGNEFKEASSSIHFKRKTQFTNQLKDATSRMTI